MALTIRLTPENFGLVDHVELETEDRVPLPLTETGYRSHFVPVGSVTEYGGAVAFVTAWLDHEAKPTVWSGAQLSFS